MYLYLVLVLGPRLMANRKPLQLNAVLVVYNAIQVIFSVFMLWEVRRSNTVRSTALQPLSHCLEIPNQLMLQTSSTQLTASSSSGVCSTGISRRVTASRRFWTPHWSPGISNLQDETSTVSRNFDSRSASDVVPYPDERNAQPHR